MEIFAFSQLSVQFALLPHLELEELIRFFNTVHLLFIDDKINPAVLQKCQTMHPYHVHSLFRQASEKGDILIVSTLLKFGNSVAGIESVEKYGYTPLILAAQNNHVEIVKMLLLAGANVNRNDMYGNSVLTKAARFGSADLVRTLLETITPYQVINLNSINIHGCSALSCAVSREEFRDPILQILLDAGADPNFGDKTPLSLARIRCRDDLVQILIQAGATR